jgi:branched-chain amino acid transport system substrate-binding protein
VKLGSVSTLSGPVGATLGGVVKGAQVWVRWINERGGVNGHPVELKVWDDGGDPARHRAQVQEAVERSHVVAFLGEAAVLSMEASFEYINAKRIPVVGTDATPQFTDNQPMYFIQVAYGKAIVYLGVGTVARRAQKLGLKKFGTITCSEIHQCDLHQGWWHQYATERGLQSAYKGKASLVQPDFTAECLAARNAGVEILAMSMDANSINRIAASCARQDYRPIYASLGPNLVPRYTEDPNLEGMILGANVLPYLATSNPAMIEFLGAMKQYAPGANVGPSEEQGWVAGKLFEKAAASLPEPPTSDAVLRGLWNIRNETLGGLTQPLTFTEGKPSSQDPSCGYDMVIEKGEWRSPDSFQLHCGTPH